MTRIHKALVTAGFLAAMTGGGAIGAVALGATGSGPTSSTTTTTPGITIAPSTGTTPSQSTPSQGSGRGDCPDHGTPGSSGASTAAFY